MLTKQINNNNNSFDALIVQLGLLYKSTKLLTHDMPVA